MRYKWQKLQHEFNQTDLTLKEFCDKKGLNYGTASNKIKVKQRFEYNAKIKNKKMVELRKLQDKQAKKEAREEFNILIEITNTNKKILELLQHELDIIYKTIKNKKTTEMDLERFIHNYTKFLGVLKDFETETSANHNDTFIIIE